MQDLCLKHAPKRFMPIKIQKPYFRKAQQLQCMQTKNWKARKISIINGMKKVLYSSPNKKAMPLMERWKYLSLLITVKPFRLHRYLPEPMHKAMLRKSLIVMTITAG